MRPPAALRVQGVLLQGPALIDVRRYFRAGVEAQRRRDGYEPTAAALGLLALIEAAAAEYVDGLMSRAGHGDVPGPADRAESSPEVVVPSSDRVGTGEAAALLQLSDRQVRRRSDLGGVKVGSTLTFDRDAVLRVAAERDEAEEECAWPSG